MRGKDYNVGLRGVLFESRHYQRMGAAVWLYGWLVLRQTHQQGSVGWVLGGAPISYREIEEETGFNSRTLERWMQTLRAHGYIETESAPAGIIVRITKAKKFPQAGRRIAEGGRRVAEAKPQSRVASRPQFLSREHFADRIGSSSVERSQEREKPAYSFTNFHKQNQNLKDGTQNSTSNPSSLGPRQNHGANENSDSNTNPSVNPNTSQSSAQNASQKRDQGAELTPREFLAAIRLQQQLLRAEREEAVRRELAVGTGPEVQHP